MQKCGWERNKTTFLKMPHLEEIFDSPNDQMNTFLCLNGYPWIIFSPCLSWILAGVKERWHGKIVLKQFSKVICPNECCWTRKGRKIPSLTAAEKLNSDWAGSLLKLAKGTANNTWWTGQALCSKIPVALPFMKIYHCTMVSWFFPLYVFKWTDWIPTQEVCTAWSVYFGFYEPVDSWDTDTAFTVLFLY